MSFQANSSCYWVSGWHFRTTTIYILSHFWASGIWHGNVTISITESQYISLDVQEARDALDGNCTEGDLEVKWAVSQALTLSFFAFFCYLAANFPISKRCSFMFSPYLLIQAIAINISLHLFLFSLHTSWYLWRWGRCVSRWRCSHCGGTGRGPAPCRREGHLRTLPSTGRAAKRHLGRERKGGGWIWGTSKERGRKKMWGGWKQWEKWEGNHWNKERVMDEQ